MRECSLVGFDVRLQLAIECARVCLYTEVQSVPSPRIDFSRVFSRMDGGGSDCILAGVFPPPRSCRL